VRPDLGEVPLKIRCLLYVLICLGIAGWVFEDQLTCAALGPEMAVYLALGRSEIPKGNDFEDRTLSARDPWGRRLRELWTEGPPPAYPPNTMAPSVTSYFRTVYSCGPNGIDERAEGDDVGIKGVQWNMGFLALEQVGRASLFAAFLAALALAVPAWPWRRGWIGGAILGGVAAWLTTRGVRTYVLESKPMGAMLSTQASVVLGGAFAAVVVTQLTTLLRSTADDSESRASPRSATG
tara:strand:+ start:168 stop:878 length:711 start_codon:yes stop_codon:yes gene_type:complete